MRKNEWRGMALAVRRLYRPSKLSNCEVDRLMQMHSIFTTHARLGRRWTALTPRVGPDDQWCLCAIRQLSNETREVNVKRLYQLHCRIPTQGLPIRLLLYTLAECLLHFRLWSRNRRALTSLETGCTNWRVFAITFMNAGQVQKITETLIHAL